MDSVNEAGGVHEIPNQRVFGGTPGRAKRRSKTERSLKLPNGTAVGRFTNTVSDIRPTACVHAVLAVASYSYSSDIAGSQERIGEVAYRKPAGTPFRGAHLHP